MIFDRISFCIGVTAGLLLLASGAHAVNSTDIEAVRSRTLESKSALSPADEAVGEKFIRDGFAEMILEPDPWRAVDVREAILAQKGGPGPSPYAAAFAGAAARHLKVALEDISRLQDPQRRSRMTLNLVTLAAGLRTTEVVPFGLDMIAHNDRTVQYWAVKTVTNPGVAAQLTSQILGDEELTRRIISRLDQAVADGIIPQTMRMIVEFADSINTPEARALINRIADLRIAQYADWTVEYELLEALVLSSLGKQIQAQNADARRADLLRRFSQLYSYVIERYVLGEQTLDERRKTQLVSVIAETENGAISEILSRPQNRLRKALEGGKASVVEAERQILLGSPTQPGQLAARFNYDYGKAAGGAPITEPLRLKVPGSLLAGQQN